MGDREGGKKRGRWEMRVKTVGREPRFYPASDQCIYACGHVLELKINLTKSIVRYPIEP